MPRKSGPHRELADAIGFKPHYLEHRSRLQERLLRGGPENLPDYEILEILLAASNPRGDTKPLAKALIDHFGGLAEVQRGTIDHTPVYPREVVKRALELNASALILGHYP